MIKGLQKTTLVDFPGKIACTIFIAGCNFRCGYCYNSDLVFCSQSIPSIKEEEIIGFLDARKGFLEGVCITGGEPTLYKGLKQLIKKIKDKGYEVKLDTNGSNPKILKELLDENLLDYVAMDIKASLDSYPKITSVKVNKNNIIESIGLIKESGIDYEFRTTLVPDVVDEKEIKGICKQIKGAKRYFIQQFKADGKTIDKRYNNMEPVPHSKLEEFRNIAREYVDKVEVRA